MKSKRQEKIIELIGQFEIDTQEELCQRLQNAGFQATQATVSRDIRELSLTKVPGSEGRPKYAFVDHTGQKLSEKFERVLRDGIISMDKADNLLVVKTVSGMAMAVAASIDSIGFPEIVGSIAGDDTIMCAIRSADLVDSVIESIKNRL